LTAALASADGSNAVLQSGTFALPFGRLDVAFDPAELRVGDRELYGFVPASELEVHGLAMRYRRPGIGAPLAASTMTLPGAEPGHDMMAPRVRVPVTAFLRIPEAQRALVDGTPLTATLELHPNWDVGSVSIAGEQVPLEQDPTAALALTFTGVPINRIEIFGFLGRLTGLLAERPPLVSISPYQRGLIPVVFVHGTASSPVRWAEMYNRLQADPEIRGRYQFWFFQYESDKPIALSALHLREALTAAVAKLDPHGEDPALRRMVMIGHSQGGLLVKMQSVDSGDVIWNSVSRKPLAELRLSDETRDLLQRGLFVQPLPEVARVVFISTPHRGSFVAARRLIASMARRLTLLPLNVAQMTADVARNRDALRGRFAPTAVDNMSPGSPFILGLQEVSVASTIPAHSIISVKGTGPAEEGDDGVVKYTSAHIDEAVSEVVVRSPHSCQGNPHTMEEVRRILRLHVGLATDGVTPGER
jgi:pimeloyl-ACP methyl ester carboxylesterase